MFRFKMLGRIIKSGRIYGYLVHDYELNKSFVVTREDVNKYQYYNVKISKDNKVHGKIPDIAYEQIFPTSNKVTLYHGSKNGIIGHISYTANSGNCDFGSGFYIGEKLEQAINRVSNNKVGIIYTFEADLSGLKVFSFDNDTEWALYVGVNRGKIDTVRYRKLRMLCNKIDASDVIIGNIADDKIAESFNDFLDGNITDRCLSESLKLISYGKQYVFKTEQACRRLKLVNKRVLTIEEKQKSVIWGKEVKLNMNTNLESLKLRYRRTGSYIDELLEQYK